MAGIMPNTLVIVGAGFSGTVLAANLLRRPPPVAELRDHAERLAVHLVEGLAAARHD